MGRVLVLLVIAVVAWFLIKRLSGESPGRRRQDSSNHNKQTEERILACAVCGVHVPRSEGVTKDGAFFCCEAHSRQSDERRGD